MYIAMCLAQDINDTRNKSDLSPSHNTKLFEQSITYNGMLVYNQLSSEIESIKSTTEFVKILNFYWKKAFIQWKNL
jgi:hypothetical protein